MTWTVLEGDCVEVMAGMPAASVDAIVCDPPYGLEFMGKEWDRLGDVGQEWHEAWAREALRVLKPGGHLLAFGGTRTYHRLACAVEDAGFEIRDTIAYMYGSGFPKSLDVSKQLDRAAGATREVVGVDEGMAQRGAAPSSRYVKDAAHGWERPNGRYNVFNQTGRITAPATPDAEQWAGWGTALKPAHEPVVVARKPLVGTVAANVQRFGTGALNIDGCRIEGAPRATGTDRQQRYDENLPSGRWPANVVLDEEAAACLDAQTGTLTSGSGKRRPRDWQSVNAYGFSERPNGASEYERDGDSGGASRFFYTAKASAVERSAGLNGKIALCRCHEANTGTSPRRDTGAPIGAGDFSSSTSGSGNKPTDLSPTDSRSTTATSTSRTTTSPTSSSSPQPITSAFTPPTTDATTPANGSDAALSAASGSRPTPSTTTSAAKAGPSMAAADPVTSGPSSQPSSSAVCADCGGVVEGAWKNTHPLEPTVKPIALMRWLVRLVTQPGGLVLDPFTGSGTTGIAACLEGFRFTGVERDPEYVKIAQARIAWWEQHPDGMELVRRLELEAERREVAASGQGSLFSDGVDLGSAA